MLKFSIIILCGAGLLACSSVNTLSVQNEQVSITKEYEKQNIVDSIVAPYRTELNKEMLEVIAYAPKSFERGKPNGSLNNWSTDAIYSSVKGKIDNDKPSFCLLNWGGLRNSINQGDVTLGDIFKLMPFDNEIVIVEMPMHSLERIEQYLKMRNGEPIGAAYIKNDKLQFKKVTRKKHESFLVVTSDYLMNGGDHMDFFQDKIKVNYPGLLMRDAMIKVAKEQKELTWSDEQRIQFEP
ncbi:MAG TPA: hypothetical protein EYG86_00140 [Crocinitomicaceae bacterium]|nr:hypothetical protein [Crocinitomicaceae bacterium]